MSKDGVTGPWWISFEEMLTEEQREDLGISEDRGAVQCIMRLCSALAVARAEGAAEARHQMLNEPSSVWLSALIDAAKDEGAAEERERVVAFLNQAVRDSQGFRERQTAFGDIYMVIKSGGHLAD